MVLLDRAAHAPTTRLDAVLHWLPDLPERAAGLARVQVHAGTAQVPARLVALAAARPRPGESGPAQLLLERPLAVAAGERLIIRQAEGRLTLGGGRVLDIAPPERHRRTPERLAVLAALAEADGPRRLEALAEISPYHVPLARHARHRGLPLPAVLAAAEARRLILLPGEEGPLAFAPGHWLRLRRAIPERLAAHHGEHPDLPGLTQERLRLALPLRLPAEALAAVLAALHRAGDLVQEGAMLRLPGHVARLSPRDEALWARIAPLLAGDTRLRPPRINELAPRLRLAEEPIRALLKRLARRGLVWEVDTDHFLLREAVAELAAAARQVGEAAPDGWFGAASYRDALGPQVGRRMAILILEFFDRHGATLRRGDLRRLLPKGLAAFGGAAAATAAPLDPPPPAA
jgi:selenocysteine-specific elongation factor